MATSSAQPSSLDAPVSFDVMRVLRRKWPLVLLVAVAALGAGALYLALRTPVYETSSFVRVRPSQAGPSQEALQDIVLRGVTEDRALAGELALLRRSLVMAERVLDEIDADALAIEAGLAPALPRRELANHLLSNLVTFEPADEDANLIRITAERADPSAAAQLANVYADVYAEFSRAQNRQGVAGSVDFLEEEAVEQQAELDRIEGEIRSFMQANDAVALSTEGERAVTQVATLEGALDEARVDLDVARTTLRELRSELARVQPGLAQRVGSSLETEINTLNARIAELEAQAADYYANDPTLRGDEQRNPELARIASRRAELQRRLETISADFVDEVMAVGGAEQVGGGGALTTSGLAYATTLQRQALEQEIAVQGLEQRVRALETQRGRYASRLSRLPADMVGLAQLERARQTAEQSFFYVTDKLSQARLAADGELGYVDLVRPALVPGAPSSPGTVAVLALALMIGLVGGVGLALVSASFDRRLRRPTELRRLGLPVLSVVPSFNWAPARMFGRTAALETADGGSLASHVAAGMHPFSPIAEAFQTLRTMLRTKGASEDGGAPPQVVGVVSAMQGEGKTTVATHLALAAARSGRRTLYIDADLRRPAGHAVFGMPPHQGLSDLVQSEGPIGWEAYRLPLHIDWGDFQTNVDSLYTVFAGTQDMTPPSSVIEAPRLAELIEQARAEFDFVVVDTPPIGMVADALTLLRLCDASALVVRSGRTVEASALRAWEALELPEGAVRAGVVLNDYAGMDDSAEPGVGYGYGYGYGDDTRSERKASPVVQVGSSNGDSARVDSTSIALIS